MKNVNNTFSIPIFIKHLTGYLRLIYIGKVCMRKYQLNCNTILPHDFAYLSCLGHLGRCETNRNDPNCVVLPKVDKASTVMCHSAHWCYRANPCQCKHSFKVYLHNGKIRAKLVGFKIAKCFFFCSLKPTNPAQLSSRCKRTWTVWCTHKILKKKHEF